jgi:hypothetical protein
MHKAGSKSGGAAQIGVNPTLMLSAAKYTEENGSLRARKAGFVTLGAKIVQIQ